LEKTNKHWDANLANTPKMGEEKKFEQKKSFLGNKWNKSQCQSRARHTILSLTICSISAISADAPSNVFNDSPDD